MRLKHLALGLAVATALPAAAVTAQAEEGIYVPLFTYRTGPFAGSGIPIANGMSRLSEHAERARRRYRRRQAYR